MSGGESNDSSQVHYGAGLSAGFNDSVSLESGFRGSAVGPDVYSSSECLPARAQFSSGLYSQPSQLYSPADDSHPLGDSSHGVSMSGRHGESHSENVVSSGAPVSDLTHMISFKSLISLQNHVNTHTGVKPHKCKECEMSFTTSGELARHTRYRHTKERPHRCPECGYATVELSKLRRHIRTHTSEEMPKSRPKIFRCGECDKNFANPANLRKHLMVHEKGDRALRDLDKDAASEMEMAVDGLDPKSPMDSDTNSTDTYACESDVL